MDRKFRIFDVSNFIATLFPAGRSREHETSEILSRKKLRPSRLCSHVFGYTIQARVSVEAGGRGTSDLWQ